MKKYVSMFLAAVLSASLLAGCGGSGSSGQQPTEKAQETAAQTEGTKEAGSTENAAQTDAAKTDTQAGADTSANSDAYMVYVMDAETMAPIPGAKVQFCSDVLCQMGKTDENGVAAIHSDSGTYTVHFMKAPDGYVNSTEELTLDEENREATFFLKKQAAESETEADPGNTGSAEPDSELDFPYAGFTFTASAGYHKFMINGLIIKRELSKVPCERPVNKPFSVKKLLITLR